MAKSIPHPKSTLRQQIDDAVACIRKHTKLVPEFGIILGTGLGGFVDDVRNKIVIPYEEIPHFPVSTVESHHGKLILGTMNGRNVVVMQGRFHLYEGYTAQQIVFPVRVMSKKAGLGASMLLISNAAGGLNPLFRRGDLMMITDHINLLGSNPLAGQNDESLGVRFPDMSEPYSNRLQRLANAAAQALQISIQRGVLASVLGPTLETRAEYRFLRNVGVDAVGMSTIPETIAAVHAGMEVFAMSIITDLGFPEALEPVNVKEIIAIASKAEPKLTKIVKEIVRNA